MDDREFAARMRARRGEPPARESVSWVLDPLAWASEVLGSDSMPPASVEATLRIVSVLRALERAGVPEPWKVRSDMFTRSTVVVEWGEGPVTLADLRMDEWGAGLWVFGRGRLHRRVWEPGYSDRLGRMVREVASALDGGGGVK